MITLLPRNSVRGRAQQSRYRTVYPGTDQASWPNVASPVGRLVDEVARGCGAAMALPTGTAIARCHELEFACEPVEPLDHPYSLETGGACEVPLFRGCTARGPTKPLRSQPVESCYEYGCSAGKYPRRAVNMTANTQYDDKFVAKATVPRHCSDDKFYSKKYHSSVFKLLEDSVPILMKIQQERQQHIYTHDSEAKPTQADRSPRCVELCRESDAEKLLNNSSSKKGTCMLLDANVPGLARVGLPPGAPTLDASCCPSGVAAQQACLSSAPDFVPKVLHQMFPKNLGCVSQRSMRSYIATHTPGLKSCLRRDSTGPRLGVTWSKASFDIET